MTFDSVPRRRGEFFWKIWEKIWWLIAIVFVAGNAWAVREFGWISLLQFWAAVFAGIGALTLVHGRRAWRRASETLLWPVTEARILSSQLVKDEQRGFSDSGQDYSRPIVYYYPEVEYEYAVHGNRYVSNRILLVRVNYPEAEARAAVGRYPPGAIVRAYYDPADPRIAILEPGRSGRYRIPIIVGAVFVAFGLGLLVAIRIWFR